MKKREFYKNLSHIPILVNIGQQKQALYMKINVFLHLEVTLKM
jgi:hypothetical protein